MSEILTALYTADKAEDHLSKRAPSLRKSWGILLAILFLFAALMTTSARAADSWISIKWGKTVVGSGKRVEVVRSVATFDQVVAGNGLRVTLRRAATPKVTVQGDDNIEPLIEAAVADRALKLRMRPNTSIRTREAVNVVIDYVQLNSVTANDGASVDLDFGSGAKFVAHAHDGATLRITEISASDFELKVNDGAHATITKVVGGDAHRYKVSDAGKLTVNSIQVTGLIVAVRDAGRMTLRNADLKSIDIDVRDGASAVLDGVAQQQTIKVSDGASLDSQKLEGQSAKVRSSDGGVAKIGKVQSLDVEAYDGGAVRYVADPTLTQNIRDGASLRKM